MSNRPPVSDADEVPPEQIPLSNFTTDDKTHPTQSLLPVPHDADDVDWYLPNGRTEEIEWYIQQLNATLAHLFDEHQTVQPSSAKAALSVYFTEATRYLAPAGGGPSPTAGDQFLSAMEEVHYSNALNTVIQLLNPITKEALNTREMPPQDVYEALQSFLTTIEYYE